MNGGLADGEKRKKSYFLEAKPETEISSLVDLLPDFLRWIFSPRALWLPDDTSMCAHGANRSSITIPTVITYYAHSLHTRSLGVNKAEIIYTYIPLHKEYYSFHVLVSSPSKVVFHTVDVFSALATLEG